MYKLVVLYLSVSLSVPILILNVTFICLKFSVHFFFLYSFFVEFSNRFMKSEQGENNTKGREAYLHKKGANKITVLRDNSKVGRSVDSFIF